MPPKRINRKLSGTRLREDDGLTLQDFARRLGVSEITGRRICKKREITYRIIKGRYIIKYGDYKDYQDKELHIKIEKGNGNNVKRTNK